MKTHNLVIEVIGADTPAVRAVADLYIKLSGSDKMPAKHVKFIRTVMKQARELMEEMKL